MQIFKGKTADEVWLKASKKFSVDGIAVESNSRAGKTKEILHAVLAISSPKNRWVASRKPAINPAFAIAEVIWIIRGCRDARFLTFFNSSLPKYAGTGSAYHGAYGYRLRKHFLMDQLSRAYHALSANPDSRQVVLQIWSSTQDIPRKNGTPASTDVPCNVSALLKIRNGQLMWSQIMRSNDLHRGTPYNFIQFTSLQEVVAGWLGIEPGEYLHFADSLHVYESDVPRHGQFSREPTALNGDSLALPKKDSEKAWLKLELFTRKLISKPLSEKTILSRLRQLSLPTAYVNLARVLAAEAARRSHLTGTPKMIMSSCDNKCLTLAWDRWALRTAGK